MFMGICVEKECDLLVKKMTEENLESRRKIRSMEGLIQVGIFVFIASVFFSF